jgi:hypothetical protein
MIASAPVQSSTCLAFCGVSISPLAITGMRTCDLTAAMVFVLGLPCEPTGARTAVDGKATTPADSAISATRVAFCGPIPAGADL